MTNDNDNKLKEDAEISGQASSTPQNPKKKRKKPLWLRVLIGAGITVGSLLLLVLLLISAAVWILTPAKLTPLVNKHASEYLLADVDAKRVELTFWHTFPRLTLQVDSLDIRSRALDTLPDSMKRSLPDDADRLLSMGRFSGGINITGLLKGNISLYDVELRETRANLIMVDSLHANYLIFPESEEPDDEKPFVMPRVSINRFLIDDGMDIRFRIPADSLDFSLGIRRVGLAENRGDRPLYKFDTSGSTSLSTIPLGLPEIPFEITGDIIWNSSDPGCVGLDDFILRVADIESRFSTRLDMTEGVNVLEFKASIPKLEVETAMKLLPADQKAGFEDLRTDMTVSLDAELLRPYDLSKDRMPELKTSVRAEAGRVEAGKLSLSHFLLDADATVDLGNPDGAVIDINEFSAKGKAIDFKISGTVRKPLTDPDIDAGFDGRLAIHRLPQRLLDRLGCAVRGDISGHAVIKTRLSYLNPKHFYRAKINGQISLHNFLMAMNDGSLESYIGNGVFRLGTNSKVTAGDHMVDSLLTASLEIDTLSLRTPEMTISGTRMTAGVGSRNIASSSDTSRINPIGARITVARLRMRSDADSMRVGLRDARINASLSRFEEKGKSALMKADVESKSIFYSDLFNRTFIRNGEASFTMHPRLRPVMSPRYQAAFDSLTMLHPELSSDSIRGLMRAGIREAAKRYAKTREGRDLVEVELDGSMKKMLMRWNAFGSLKARRARFFTPYFPSRNTLKDIDLAFSTDSVVLRDTRLRMNHSDFTLNGTVRDIRKALMSRGLVPYKFEFKVESDTIDVNDLTATMIRGAVFAEKVARGQVSGTFASGDGSEEDLEKEQSHREASDTTMSAVLIPSNIKGKFTMRARNVLYDDLWLHRLVGIAEVYDGALNLDRMRASTNIGSVSFSALYNAPTADNLSLAAAMRVRKLNLRSVLDMIPQIDTLLPLLKEVKGIVNAELALTTRLDTVMNFDIGSINMAMKISGDSLQLLDNETFRTLSKWMMFKNKKRNIIDKMDVELAIHDGFIDLYPFIFDMDRYRIGVRGSNDAAFNLNYHVAVLKSPMPFKFGINIKGTPDKMKYSLGKARINEKTIAESRQITDTVRVNLIREINKTFRRGMRATGSRGLRLQGTRRRGAAMEGDVPGADTFTHADSVALIREGLIKAPAGFAMPDSTGAPAPRKP